METVEQFLARGGKVEKAPEGERKISKHCFCGCRGRFSVHAENAAAYTGRSMRDAENQEHVRNVYYGTNTHYND